MVTNSLPSINRNRFPVDLSQGFEAARQEMDRLFDRFFPRDARGLSPSWYAPLAIWDDNEQLHVEVELPGVSKDDLEVVVHQGMLRIAGERKAPEGQRNYWHSERRYGRFERSLTLPEGLDWDSIQADLKDGVLCITLSKKPEAQPKKITVNGS